VFLAFLIQMIVSRNSWKWTTLNSKESFIWPKI